MKSPNPNSWYLMFKWATYPMLIVSFSSQAASWMCDMEDQKKEVNIEYPGADLLPCRVIYSNVSENLLNQQLWSTSEKEGYCEAKARDFLLYLESKGWSCKKVIPSYDAALNQYLENSSKEKSSFTSEELAVMDRSARQLEIRMPHPGLKVGSKAPSFILSNALDEPISLKEELKKGPVVLVFYRGAWCPFCNMHLQVLRQSLPEFRKYKASVIAITPQKPDKSVEQFKDKGFPFEVLSDIDSQVMKAYRLYFELSADLVSVYKSHGLDIEDYNGEGRTLLPVPGTFVIDQKGIVRAMHADTDYKQRMEPAVILEVLQKMAE